MINLKDLFFQVKSLNLSAHDLDNVLDGLCDNFNKLMWHNINVLDYTIDDDVNYNEFDCVNGDFVLRLHTDKQIPHDDARWLSIDINSDQNAFILVNQLISDQ